MIKVNLDEMYAKDIYPADAAIILARANGFDNVTRADCETLEWVGESMVILLDVTWLDTCEGEEADLVLTNAQYEKRADRLDDEISCYVANTISSVTYDMQEFEDFARLFVY